MNSDAPRASGAASASVIVAYAGVLVVGFIAVAAATRLGAQVDAVWAALPGEIGFRGVVMALVAATLVAAAIAFIRRAPDSYLRWMPWGAMLVLVGIRAVAIPLVDTPLPDDNDPRFLHDLAVGALDGGNWLVSPRPMGFSAMLAALYAVFGIQPVLAELLNLALAVVVGWMAYLLVLRRWGPRPAAMALLLYAVAPSQVLLVTTIFTEVAYSAVLMAAVAVCAAATGMNRIVLAMLAGAVLGMSQYVRPFSQAFLATFAAVPFLAGLRPSRATALAAAMIVTFLVVLTPIAVHNLRGHGDLSLSTSSYGGWSLFVGANQSYTGMFNRKDQAILRQMEGSVWERSEILGRAGVERITSDVGGFAKLAVRKFRVMWGDDTYAVGAALSGSGASPMSRATLELVSQAFYAATAIGATVSLWRMRKRPPVEALVLVGILGTMVVAHTFIEVQPRYHAYAVPILCVLAALAIGRPSGVNGPQRQVPGAASGSR